MRKTAVINSDYIFFIGRYTSHNAFLFCFSDQVDPAVSLKKFILYTRVLYGIAIILLLYRKAVRASMMISNSDRYLYIQGDSPVTQHANTRFWVFSFDYHIFEYLLDIIYCTI